MFAVGLPLFMVQPDGVWGRRLMIAGAALHLLVSLALVVG